MKVLRSKKGIPIPKLFFVSDRAEIKDIPHGVPYIFGDESTENYIVQIMEYEVLYQKALESGFPFDFRKILTENGFDIYDCGFDRSSVRLNLSTTGDPNKQQSLKDSFSLVEGLGKFQEFIRDSSVYVDISVIKDLKIFPVWLDSIEDAVNTNIHNFATYDSNMYNKKLDGMYGGIQLKSPNKNLIVIDISSSIPRAVSTTILALAKNLSENFYADIMITGSKTTLYDYSEIDKLDINTIYEENGEDNDQVYFKKLLTADEREYDTVIVFGDNDIPGYDWSNEFNHGTRTISTEDGKALCLWKVNKLISFHTTSRTDVAGYGDWFSPNETIHIENWVKDIDSRAKSSHPEYYN